MATWTTNTTSTDDVAPTLPEKIRDAILGWGFKILKLLLLILFVMAECFSLQKIDDTGASPATIREEMDSLIRSGATKELEIDTDRGSDLELYRTMMTLVTNMRFGDFELDGEKAEEFWGAYAPEAKSDTKPDYIRFQSAERRVYIRYSNGISSQIVMEFDNDYLCKSVYMNKGIFNGNVFSWLAWKLVGRFAVGYPCYVSEADMDGNGIRGDIRLRKYTVRNQVFSWRFTPGRKERVENISEHWVVPAT